MIPQEFLKKAAILINFSNKESPQPAAGLEHLRNVQVRRAGKL
jgi:hypothetical protein